jgi:hypothetical protein
MNGAHESLIDSYVHLISWSGVEAHGVGYWNGPGPIKLVNNYVEGSGIPHLAGGGVPKFGTDAGRPMDVEVRRNHWTKRLTWNRSSPTWDGGSRNCKGAFETKNVFRILVEGNLADNAWPDGQSGMLYVWKGGADDPGEGLYDATIRYNLGGKCTIGMNPDLNDVLGRGEASVPADQTLDGQRVAIYHNLLEQVGGYFVDYDRNGVPDTTSGLGRSWAITEPGHDMYYRHNTIVSVAGIGSTAVTVNAGRTHIASNLTWTDDIFAAAYIHSDSAGLGLLAIEGYSPGTWVFTRNVMVGDVAPSQTESAVSHNAYPATFGAVGFWQPPGQRLPYHIAPSSPYYTFDTTDGSPAGANVVDVETATLGVA